MAKDLGGVFEVGVLLVDFREGFYDAGDVLADGDESLEFPLIIEFGLDECVHVVYVTVLGSIGDHGIPDSLLLDGGLIHVRPEFFWMIA